MIEEIESGTIAQETPSSPLDRALVALNKDFYQHICNSSDDFERWHVMLKNVKPSIDILNNSEQEKKLRLCSLLNCLMTLVYRNLNKFLHSTYCDEEDPIIIKNLFSIAESNLETLKYPQLQNFSVFVKNLSKDTNLLEHKKLLIDASNHLYDNYVSPEEEEEDY